MEDSRLILGLANELDWFTRCGIYIGQMGMSLRMERPFAGLITLAEKKTNMLDEF